MTHPHVDIDRLSEIFHEDKKGNAACGRSSHLMSAEQARCARAILGLAKIEIYRRSKAILNKGVTVRSLEKIEADIFVYNVTRTNLHKFYVSQGIRFGDNDEVLLETPCLLRTDHMKSLMTRAGFEPTPGFISRSNAFRIGDWLSQTKDPIKSAQLMNKIVELGLEALSNESRAA